MARRKRGVAQGRYDERLIAARVEARRRKLGVEIKQICADLGIEKWDWSRKVRLDNSTFSIPELSKIAEVLDAPPGWPFLDDEAAELLAEKRQGSKSSPSGPKSSRT